MAQESPLFQIGRYRVERKLGEGQMGDVYAARAPDGTAVAVKLLKLEGSKLPELQARFRREAELCRALSHPNVVTVSDYGVHEGSPFLTMPILRGADLEAWLERAGALAPEVAVAIAQGAAAGLVAAHARGIVHRDFKPANVFLDEREAGALQVVVCDFGVAKVYDEDGALTASGAVLGTPLYMAPEQLLDSKRVDARCDVWALGMVLYHALAGRAALGDIRGLGDLVVALRDNAIPPLQSFAPWVPAALARVVHAALLPLGDRIATVTELSRALAAWGPAPVPLTSAVLVRLADDRRSYAATRATLPKHASELGTPDEATQALGQSPRARSEAPPDAFIGALVDGRYRVTTRLGGGGMGTVYEARDEKAAAGEAEVVALKVMIADGSGTEGARRFVREARSAARIDSPHVAKVLASGVDAQSGAPYLVMERLRGVDLAQLIARHGALEPEVAIALVVQAAEALGAAHAIGVVHRDVKPSNLFVHEGADGVATLKVCDFGIAKQLSREGAETATELTASGGMLGSPLYMSPEQARSAKNVDERSDVFSLALTLHEALTGHKPWEGRTSMGEIILAVCTEDVPRVELMAPWVPSAVCDVVARALARAPAARTPSVLQLREELTPFALPAPVKTSDLRAVTSERRSKIEPRGPSSAGFAAPVVTADAVFSGTRPETARSSPLVAIVLAVLGLVGVVAIVLGIAWRARQNQERTAIHALPQETASAPPAPVTSASVQPATSASASPSASASASVASAPSSPPSKRPNGPGTASARASAAPSATTIATTKATSSFGRGNTATELPP